MIRMLRLMWRSSPRWTAANASLIAGHALTAALSLYALQSLIDGAMASIGLEWRAAADTIALPALAVVGLALLAALLRSLSAVAIDALALYFHDRLQSQLTAKAIAVDQSYYERPHYFDNLHRAQKEADFRPFQIVSSVSAVAQNTGSLLTVGAVMLIALPPTIAVVVVTGAILELIIKFRSVRLLFEWQKTATPEERRLSYLTSVLTGDRYSKEIRLLDLGTMLIARTVEIRRRLRTGRLAVAWRRATGEFAGQGLAAVALLGSFGYLALQVAQKALSLGTLVMYYQGFQRAQILLGGLTSGLATLHENRLFLASVDDFLELKNEVVAPASPQHFPLPMRSGISFERVSFSYEAGARPSVRDVSLAIPAGATVAIVGENGSGKTTLIKLLARLHDPMEGRITIDGIDLRDLALADLRRNMAVLPQDYGRYQTTALENIWFGDVSAPADRATASAAAQHAGADRVLGGLPLGIDSILGSRFEGGTELSAGEWQRIALARAFFRAAQILVLDEPTSSLDVDSEYQLFCRLRDRAAAKTAVVVTHRLQNARIADRIYVMSHGSVVEQGTHAELIRAGGPYAAMSKREAAMLAGE